MASTGSLLVPQNASQGGVPASATAQAGPNIEDILRNIVTPIDPTLIKAATTPIARPTQAQVPSSLMRPIQPHQNTPFMSTQEVVGHKYGKEVGIGNAITGVANALGTVVKAEGQHKQDQVRDAATKVINAQQAIDEATQQRDAAQTPEDAAKFQKIISDNENVRNGIFADPKMRKSLQKGFDISYTDPESNKTTEHAAVMEAIKNAKTAQDRKQAVQQLQQQRNAAAGKAAGEAFAKQQPRGLAPNLIAQQKLQVQLEQQKNQVESVRAMAPYFAAQARAGAQVDAANVKAAVDLRIAAVKSEDEINKALIEQKTHQQDRQAAINLEYLKSSLEKQRQAAEKGDPNEIMKEFQTTSKNYLDALDKNQKSRQALNDELDKKPGSSREAEIRSQLTTLDAQDTAAKNAFEAGKNFAVKQSKLDPKQFEVQVPVPHVGDSTNAPSRTSSTSSTDDLDPRTGKPFKSNVPAADRILIKTLAGLSGIVADFNKATDFTDDIQKADKFLSGEDEHKD